MARQIFPCVTNATATNNLAFNPFVPVGFTWIATAFATLGRIHKDTVVSNFYVYLASAIGGTATWTIYKNGVATAITVTITGSAPGTSGSDTTNSVAFSAGDTIEIRRTTSGANAVVNYMTWQSDTVALADAIHGFRSGNLNATAVRNSPLFTGNGSWKATVESWSVVAAPGTIDGWHMTLSAAPGAGNDFTFVIYKNGVKQDGTGGTVDTTITISGTDTVGSASFSLAVVRGDTLYIEATPTSSPTISNPRWSVGFVGTTPGTSTFPGFLFSSIGGGDIYTQVSGEGTSAATESGQLIQGGWNGIFLRDFTVDCNASPGGGGSYDFVLRVNSASPGGGPVCTLTGSETADQDNKQKSIATGDTLDILVDVTGSPGAITSTNWGFVMSASAGGGGGAGKGKGGGKKGGGGGLNVLYPLGAIVQNVGNPGLDIGST